MGSIDNIFCEFKSPVNDKIVEELRRNPYDEELCGILERISGKTYTMRDEIHFFHLTSKLQVYAKNFYNNAYERLMEVAEE